MNIVSTILQYLAPAIVSRMASSLGIESSLAQKAIAAAIPTILAGLAGKASSPDGARALANSIGQQDPGLLGNLTNILGGSQQGALVNAGSSVLGSLLGGSQVGGLAGALGKFAGLGDTASKGLLGMLAPVVLGQLGQVQKKSNLDAMGLASLLGGQKDNIAAAMPAGFSQLLGGTGLLDSISGNLKNVQAAAPVAPAPRPAASGGMGRWLAIGAAALLGLLAYNMLSRKAPEVAVPAKPAAPSVAVPAAVPGVPAGVEIGKQATTIVDGLRNAFGGIKDKATAEAALPSLKDYAGKLDGLRDSVGKLDPTARKTVADLISSLVPGLKGVIDTALALPGVGDLLRQPAGDILTKLGGLAKV